MITENIGVVQQNHIFHDAAESSLAKILENTTDWGTQVAKDFAFQQRNDLVI